MCIGRRGQGEYDSVPSLFAQELIDRAVTHKKSVSFFVIALKDISLPLAGGEKPLVAFHKGTVLMVTGKDEDGQGEYYDALYSGSAFVLDVDRPAFYSSYLILVRITPDLFWGIARGDRVRRILASEVREPAKNDIPMVGSRHGLTMEKLLELREQTEREEADDLDLARRAVSKAGYDTSYRPISA